MTVSEIQQKTDVYYQRNDGGNMKVKLSPQMAAKIISIIGEKPRAYSKLNGPKAAPIGLFVVGKRTYEYFGFLYFEIDDTWGHTWQDNALAKFWDAVHRAGDDVQSLAQYKP
jgi:hypothetical protein